MTLSILDKNFSPTMIMESYKSLIWTDRYDEYGDFELVVPISADLFENVKIDYYVTNDQSEHSMIIETIEIITDEDEGTSVKISGRSLESILCRRVVWTQRVYSGSIQERIHMMLDEAIINAGGWRTINNFIFQPSSDPISTSKDYYDISQYTGDNLYESISTICKTYALGFKVILDYNRFIFSLYKGENRSYNQSDNPYVVFSPEFDNIINSRYLESTSIMCDSALIGGEGEGASRRYVSIDVNKGLYRRELFVDARNIQSDAYGEKPLSPSEYNMLLVLRGKERLGENPYVKSFDGKVETTKMFVYGEDFFLGDIVQIQNEYGHSANSRISEVVFSDDKQGFKVYPTFTILQ